MNLLSSRTLSSCLASPIAPELPASRLFTDSKGFALQANLVEHWKVSLPPPPHPFGWIEIGGKLKISPAEEKQKTWCWRYVATVWHWQYSCCKVTRLPTPFCKASNTDANSFLYHIFTFSMKACQAFYIGWIEITIFLQLWYVSVDGWKNCDQQNAIYELKMPENQFLLAWLTWGEPLLEANWNKLGNFIAVFLLRLRLPWIVFFGQLPVFTALVKNSPIECAVKRGNYRQWLGCKMWAMCERKSGHVWGTRRFPPRGGVKCKQCDQKFSNVRDSIMVIS